MVTLAIIGGSMTILVVLVLTLMWVSSRSEQSPEQRRLRARRDQEKSRAWLHGRLGGGSGAIGDGYSGCAGGGGDSGGSCAGGGCGGGGDGGS
jgi:hypothetical protein